MNWFIRNQMKVFINIFYSLHSIHVRHFDTWKFMIWFDILWPFQFLSYGFRSIQLNKLIVTMKKSTGGQSTFFSPDTNKKKIDIWHFCRQSNFLIFMIFTYSCDVLLTPLTCLYLVISNWIFFYLKYGSKWEILVYLYFSLMLNILQVDGVNSYLVLWTSE